ncbi:ArsS family sensor histidine kinase [Nitrosophilus alvini]|uniref:ArsS family sensor histidine kinase n=1 Tax=Nitrosophilus alvini TaxID=2714855 RepID=UPI0022778780|nr:ArsS family sensor histidine kinase [Nitrosophilus alvini]
MSIRKKITLLFIFSLLVMVSIAFWAEMTTERKNETIQINRYMSEAKEIISLIAKGKRNRLEKRLNELGLRIIDKKSMTDYETVFKKPHTFGEIKILKRSNRFYLFIRYLDVNLLLYDTAQEEIQKERLITNTLIFLDIAVLVFIYTIIIKILSPINDISSKMREISKGDFNARVDVKSTDEIGDMAKSFNEMASKLQKVLNSKEELIRDVGHELRTPIAKGKFALEMIDDSKGKEIIKRAFEELESLTAEILYIQMMEDKDSLKKEKFKISTLILEALSKTNIENEEDITVKVLEDFDVEGDLHYLSIALKNLIDNALKYSEKKPIVIEADCGKVSVLNDGKRLDKSLSYYIQPFVREEKREEGFGLGLNIVYKVLKKHKFVLKYDYQEGKNRFTIVFFDNERGQMPANA